jgi:hypothetical protein
MICKLGYAIHWDRGILDRPCHVCAETDCEESLNFDGWGDDDEDPIELGEPYDVCGPLMDIWGSEEIEK